MPVPYQITAINSFVDYLAQEAKVDNMETFSAASCNALASVRLFEITVDIID